MQKIWENNESEKIGLVTPTPECHKIYPARN